MPDELVVKEFTVRQVYEALDANGWEHLRGIWIDTMGGTVFGGCVLGQTAVNLGIAPNTTHVWQLFTKLRLPIERKVGLPTKEYLEAIAHNLESQLDKFTPDSNNKWVEDFIDNNAGDKVTLTGVIVYWNDKESYEGYALKTYQEVAAMAKELMEPFFDEKVQLLVYDGFEIDPEQLQRVTELRTAIGASNA